jgi:hypothetical protein
MAGGIGSIMVIAPRFDGGLFGCLDEGRWGCAMGIAAESADAATIAFISREEP